MLNHVNRERWVVFSKHEMVNHMGEATNRNVEVPNSKHLSRAFPLAGRADMLAFAKLFLHQDYLVQDDLPATAILREFFLPNAIRPTTMTFPKTDDRDGHLLGWAETHALEFYAVVKASDVKNQVLLQDTLDWRATTKGPGYVSISTTIPMETEEDMMHFVQGLTGGFLLDFMQPKCRVHLTNYTYQGERPRIYQVWQPMVDVPDDEQEEEWEEESGEEGEEDEEPVRARRTAAHDIRDLFARQQQQEQSPPPAVDPDPAPPAADAEDDAEDDAVLEAARDARRSAAADAAEARAAAGEAEDALPVPPAVEREQSIPDQSMSESSSDEEDYDEAPAQPQDKEVIQALMGKLFEEKGKMTEGMYLAVSSSLKRRHDQIGR
jgi:hypothetical protein